MTTITSEDVNTYNGNEIEITATYNISVYAKAEGYNDSEIVTATLCWIEAEGTPTSINNRVEANAVLIQSYNGTLTITGAIEGALIEVYNVTGHNIASVSAKNGTTTIETALNAGGDPPPTISVRPYRSLSVILFFRARGSSLSAIR